MADILTLKKFEALSPFEIKDELINLAKATSRTTQSAFLNAGRGNPNWIATTPREGFFLLGQFAVTESKRVLEHPAGIGGMPQAGGIAARFEAWRTQAVCLIPVPTALRDNQRVRPETIHFHEQGIRRQPAFFALEITAQVFIL